MTPRTQTRGPCLFCGRALTRSGMARHLPACAERRKWIEASGRQGPGPETYLHLQVEDAYSGEYWLHLEMAGSATLATLDGYLRAIWLECCDHLSDFTEGRRGRSLAMEDRALRALRPGTEIMHFYDFGTTSETRIKVIGGTSGKKVAGPSITLMARNDPPPIECMECDEPAAWLCMQCVYDEDLDGGLCATHAENHSHGDYGEPLPVVNSPRMGMCGYTGPATAP